MSCGGSSGLFGISVDFFGGGGGGGGMTLFRGRGKGERGKVFEFVVGLGFRLGVEGEAGTVVGGVGIGTEFVRCADAADVIIVQVTIAKITCLTRSIFIFPSYPFPFPLLIDLPLRNRISSRLN